MAAKNGMEQLLEMMLKPIITKMVGTPQFDNAVDVIMSRWTMIEKRVEQIDARTARIADVLERISNHLIMLRADAIGTRNATGIGTGKCDTGIVVQSGRVEQEPGPIGLGGDGVTDKPLINGSGGIASGVGGN